MKLFRKISEWEWYDDPVTFKVFLHFLITARWQDGSWHGIEIKRGEVLESLPSIAQKNGLTVQNVRTAIQHLLNTNSITIRKSGRCHVYRVSEYEKYQGQPDYKQESNREVTENQQKGNREVTENQQKGNREVTAHKESKESKESKEGKKERVLRESKDSLSQSDQIAHGMEANVEAIPLTDGTEWRPTVSEYDEYCRLYPSVDVFDSFRRMRAWSLSNPTKKKTRNGVKRFVNTWLSKEQDNSGKVSTRGSGSAYIDAIHNRMDVVDRWLERTEGDDKAGVYNAGEGDEGRVF
jgi:hypothetical protein